MGTEKVEAWDCFIRFKQNISSISLPEKFTFPFYYTPHPLCEFAVQELQEYLQNDNSLSHDFGLHRYVDGTNIGKMFGVLIVQNVQGELGYLAAYSGKLGGKNDHPHFVPPIVDLLKEDGFFRKEEAVINGINTRILELEQSSEYLSAKEDFEIQRKRSDDELASFRVEMKSAKKARNEKRKAAETELIEIEFDELKESLKNESLKYQYDYKQLVLAWKTKVQHAKDKLDVYENLIEELKQERKHRSSSLQRDLFNQYQFLNIEGQTKGLVDIFENTTVKVPPSGAGDCAGPKMLQYAFAHDLKPLAMAEFWWGQSPRSEIRKHGNYYPSCRGKCEPILGHMLQGMQVDENPMLIPPADDIKLEIIYEDNALLVINKPPEFLSVPGKTTSDSVYTRILQDYPEISGSAIVHRLDMSTSGLLVIAKTKEVHKRLQSQFLKRTVKKSYIALLEGIVEGDSGVIDLPLRVDLDDRPRQLVCYEYGKNSVTEWEVIKKIENRTRIRFSPITGRTHQLRVHSAHPLGLNTPIVGDDLYGKKEKRLYLHAASISFVHPVTKEILEVTVDPDF